MTRRVLVLCGIVMAMLAFDARAQNPDDAQIRSAVRRGVQFLKSRQNGDGTWSYSGHEVGITSLAALALVESDMAIDDPSVKAALDYVRHGAQQEAMTYDISLAILLLSRVNDPDDRELILHLGRRLVAGQLSSGGWTYFCPQVPQSPPGSSGSVTNMPRGKAVPGRPGRLRTGVVRRANFGDNSNTQFAVLGIWAAGRAGLDVKESMEDVDRRFRGTQSPGGGWGYTASGDTDAMTCAGLMSLALAKGHKVLEGQMTNRRPEGDQPEDSPDKRKMDSDAQIDRGIQRVEFYANHISAGSTLYFLWSVERVAVALGMSRIGHVDWYNRGAAVLLRNQGADGGWRSNRHELADTSFALLFLRRSNLADDMPQLVSGRYANDSSENQMRAGRLDDLKRSVRTPDSDK